jgi:hypothetical protein
MKFMDELHGFSPNVYLRMSSFGFSVDSSLYLQRVRRNRICVLSILFCDWAPRLRMFYSVACIHDKLFEVGLRRMCVYDHGASPMYESPGHYHQCNV